MTPDLSRRLAKSMALGLATPDERARLIAAAGPAYVKAVTDLPTWARELLSELDRRPNPLRRA
jgi:hypothetical protein